jgi:hypothetical protein
MNLFFQGHGFEDFVHRGLTQLRVTALAACKGQNGGGNQDGFFHKIIENYIVVLYLYKDRDNYEK